MLAKLVVHWYGFYVLEMLLLQIDDSSLFCICILQI